MPARALRILPLALVLAFSSALRAEEKVVVLKNGRTIRGEVVEDTDKRVVVKTDNGRVELSRDMVARVEDAPAKGPKDSEPSRTGDPVRPTTGGTGSPGVTPGDSTPRVSPAVELAPAAVVSECKAALAKIDATDEQFRDSRLDTLVSRFGCAPHVAIIAEPRAMTGDDKVRKLAIRAVSRAGRIARDDLVRAVVKTQGEAYDVIPLLEPIFEPPVEDALDDVLMKMPVSSQRVTAEMFGRVGTRRSAKALADLILNCSDADPSLPVVGGTAFAAIGNREQTLHLVVIELVRAMPNDKLPKGLHLDGALIALASATPDCIPVLKRMLAGIKDDRIMAKPDEKERISTCEKRLAAVYRSMATTNDPDAFQSITDGIDREEDAALRARWIRCLSQAPKGDPDPWIVKWLVKHWLSKSEDQAVCREVLTTLTKQGFGANLAAWRRYADGLPDHK